MQTTLGACCAVRARAWSLNRSFVFMLHVLAKHMWINADEPSAFLLGLPLYGYQSC